MDTTRSMVKGKNMKKLYYVRHGESHINTNDMWADSPGSQHDLGLTDLGRELAVNGATKVKAKGLKPDLILCSPLMRTRETASIIASELGYPLEQIEFNDLFLEIQVGELEGTSYKKFIKKYTYADFDQFAGAETIEDLQNRAERALRYVKSRPEKVILVVSHSCFGRAFRRVIDGSPYTEEFNGAIPLPYGEILRLI